jgi:hypothetical protein
VVAASPKEFAEAVRMYPFGDVRLDHAAVDAAGRTCRDRASAGRRAALVLPHATPATVPDKKR